MKIYLPNTSQQSIGGGWTFRSNLIKGGKGLFEVVDKWQDCDVILITGATMTSREEMNEAKKAGKKIVFRIDNMPKDSRNRGTAFSRMKDFGLMADYLIFQSQWSLDYVGWWLANKIKVKTLHPTQEKGFDVTTDGEVIVSVCCKSYDYEATKASVIYNGVDTEYFFHKDKPKERKGNIYLYVQFNRDENKRFAEAAYHFYNLYKTRSDVELWMIGNFSPDTISYNFDFFNDEKVTYFGQVEDRMQLGNYMRQAKYLYFPAYLDSSPQTLHEGLACGLTPICINEEGGSIEILNRWNSKVRYSIKEMCEDYYKIFKKIIDA